MLINKIILKLVNESRFYMNKFVMLSITVLEFVAQVR